MGGLQGILFGILEFIMRLPNVLLAVAVLVFLWGMVVFMAKQDDEGRKIGRKRMVWGVVAIFVIVSLWGFVNVIIDTFGIGGVGSCFGVLIENDRVLECF